MTFTAGDTVKLYGKTVAKVLSVHAGGKKLQVDTGAKVTFVSATNAVGVMA